jgi:hypothetical protein
VALIAGGIIMFRRMMAVFAMSTLAVVLVARADEAPKASEGDKKKDTPAVIQEEARVKQQLLKERFQKLESDLQTLHDRLAKSSKKEDREQAQVIKEALALISKEGIDIRFDQLVTVLQKSKPNSLQEVKDAADAAEMQAKLLQLLVDKLSTESRDAAIKAEKERIEKILKELDQVIRQQKIVRRNTERGDGDIKDLQNAQGKVTDNAQKVANAMGGKGETKEANKGEGKGDGKGEGKGEG